MSSNDLFECTSTYSVKKQPPPSILPSDKPLILGKSESLKYVIFLCVLAIDTILLWVKSDNIYDLSCAPYESKISGKPRGQAKKPV